MTFRAAGNPEVADQDFCVKTRRLPAFAQSFERLTHYIFRYPAKFHPPVARMLLERYTRPGQTVLDPFVGSGTLLVEALASGRHSIGLDVDPVAVAISSAKVRRYQPGSLRASAATVLRLSMSRRRADADYERMMFEDLTDRQFQRECRGVAKYIPSMPNIDHWFRRYVIIDLARIRRAITIASIPETHRGFLNVIFASIIRNSSNADPVPVSGLEVTAHMRRRDAEGRLVNPFALFERATIKALGACEELYVASDPCTLAQVVQGNAIRTHRHVRRNVDAVITSPPYHGAVDYYRRHKLEMFWLGSTSSQQDRQKLLYNYIGRPKVPQRDPLLAMATLATSLARDIDAEMRRMSAVRADAFRHYIAAMTYALSSLSRLLPSGAPAVFVVGHSTWNGTEIPTSTLFEELAGSAFTLDERLSYPVKNRYMSYSRHNGADIATEHVLVLRRTTSPGSCLMPPPEC